MAWEDDLLAYIGAPVTENNVANLAGWAAFENLPAWTHNPLATTAPEGANGYWNSVGVRTYPTEQAGVTAMGDTLLQGSLRYGYERIIQVLRVNGSWADLSAAVDSTPWGTDIHGPRPGGGPPGVTGIGGTGGGIPGGGGVVFTPVPTTLAPTTSQAWENYQNFIANVVPDMLIGLGWISTAIAEA